MNKIKIDWWGGSGSLGALRDWISEEVVNARVYRKSIVSAVTICDALEIPYNRSCSYPEQTAHRALDLYMSREDLTVRELWRVADMLDCNVGVLFYSRKKTAKG